MFNELRHILPSLPPDVVESFAVHETSQQFYREVRVRSEFRRYCEWYSTTAERHRQELERMRGELNIFQFFRRK